MNKMLKIRIENTTNGYVEELESNCALIVSVGDEDDDKKTYPVTIHSAANCYPAMLVSLIRAVDREKKEIEKRIFLGFREYLSQLFDKEKESDK